MTEPYSDIEWFFTVLRRDTQHHVRNVVSDSDVRWLMELFWTQAPGSRRLRSDWLSASLCAGSFEGRYPVSFRESDTATEVNQKNPQKLQSVLLLKIIRVVSVVRK